MYKLLIVDDERLIRERLKKQLDWPSYKIKLIGEAGNALEALELIAVHRPDIILADIHLPGISGLEMAERALQYHPRIRIIFISAHSEFDYALTAMQLKAVAYLLKPIETEELRKVITESLLRFKLEEIASQEKKLNEKKMNEMTKEKFFHDLLLDVHDIDDMRALADFTSPVAAPAACIVIVTELDRQAIANKGWKQRDIQNRLSRLHDYLTMEFGRICPTETVKMSESRVAAILMGIGGESGQAVSELKRTATRMVGQIEALCEVPATIAFGSVTEEPGLVHQSYEAAKSALDCQTIVYCNDRIIDYRDTEKPNKGIPLTDLSLEIAAVFKGIDDLNPPVAALAVDQLMDRLYAERRSLSFVRSVCVSLISRLNQYLIEQGEQRETVFGSEFFVWEKLGEIDRPEEIRRWIRSMFNAVAEYMDLKKNGRKSRLVQAVIQYVDERYDRDIALKDIATELHFSTNYVGQMFKKETGQTFQEYVIKRRMELAKTLLKGTSLKVYEIAERIGYRNIAHFSSQFKLYVGVTPNGFRDNVQ